MKISRIGPLNALNKMAIKNVGAIKKLTFFIWEDVYIKPPWYS